MPPFMPYVTKGTPVVHMSNLGDQMQAVCHAGFSVFARSAYAAGVTVTCLWCVTDRQGALPFAYWSGLPDRYRDE